MHTKSIDMFKFTFHKEIIHTKIKRFFVILTQSIRNNLRNLLSKQNVFWNFRVPVLIHNYPKGIRHVLEDSNKPLTYVILS